MRDEDEQPVPGEAGAAETTADQRVTSRRNMLRIGTLGAAAVVTIRPGMAQAALTSALTCQIALPLAADAGKWIKNDGTTVKAPPPTVANSYAPPSSPLKGEDVKNAIKYSTKFPGTTTDQTNAYLNYMSKNLKSGKPGFTCYASLQSPARY